MARLHEIKQMMLNYDASIVDINWQYLKQGELKKLLKWEMNQHPNLGCSVMLKARVSKEGEMFKFCKGCDQRIEFCTCGTQREISDLKAQLTAALTERDEARERVKELKEANYDLNSMLCNSELEYEKLERERDEWVKTATMNAEASDKAIAKYEEVCRTCDRDALAAQLDTAWQQSAEAMREAAAAIAFHAKNGLVDSDKEPYAQTVYEAIRALPVPERKVG